MSQIMNAGAILIAPVVALVLAVTMPVDAARPSHTIDRSRHSRVRVEVRIQADTRGLADSLVQQTLVLIRKDTQDGQWLVVSAGPLLDNFRLGDEPYVAWPDTLMKQIRHIAANAGLSPTDTFSKFLGRRILRSTILAQDAVKGWVRREASGAWVFNESADEINLEAEFARMRVDDDNADRAALMKEIARQRAR